MPRRHVNSFEVLGLDADPTPGDPEALLGKLVPTYTSLGDDAAAAADVLTSQEVTEGRGEAMEKLREVVGTKYPEKLRKAATSFREAAEAYSAYARTLSETQSEIDRAMDQALPVATLAAEAPPQPASDASADDRRAAQQRGAQIDDARGVLTGARRLAADAKALREQAAGKLSDELEHVTVVPARSLFQKFLEWFKNNPVLQIILGIVVGIVSIFFPIVGFALGALTFGLLTAFNTLATGKLDVGALVVGFLTLGFGGGMAAIRLIPSIGAKVGRATSSAGRFLTSLPGPIGPGLRSTGDFIRNSPILKKALLGSTEGFVPGAVINSIGGAINAKNGTPFNAAVIFTGALAGGFAGGAGGALATRFGPGLNSAFGKTGASAPPATRSAPPVNPAPAPAPVPAPAPAPAPVAPPAPSRPATPDVQPAPGTPAPSRPASPAPSTQSEFETAPSTPVTG
ncbi:hypothetical protein I6N91_12755, partial [Arthrobacter sp. MSA 4-2]|nr:hypothetical protein [Arthrobacter sp. MSA 4-2]